MKEKLDFKLINIALIVVISYLIYKSSSLWITVLDKLFEIIIPLFIGFVFAYATNPFLNFLKKYKIPKYISIFIILLFIFIIILILIKAILPLSNQIITLANYVIQFLNSVEIVNVSEIINKITIYISSNAIKTISASIEFITSLIISIVSFIYFLLDMDKIRSRVKTFLLSKSHTLYEYIYLIDNEMKKYIGGFTKIIVISFFEYTILYYIIGHPNALLLGILSSLGNFIPYFGGIMVQLIAVITSLTISNSLGLTVIIATLISGIIDSYVINPLVYGKTNEISPIVVIISIFIGGSLLGIIGILISLPFSIILINSYKFYKKRLK